MAKSKSSKKDKQDATSPPATSAAMTEARAVPVEPEPAFNTSLELTPAVLSRVLLSVLVFALPVATALNETRAMNRREPLSWTELGAVYFTGVIFGEAFWRLFIWSWVRAVKSVRESGQMGESARRKKTS